MYPYLKAPVDRPRPVQSTAWPNGSHHLRQLLGVLGCTLIYTHQTTMGVKSRASLIKVEGSIM